MKQRTYYLFWAYLMVLALLPFFVNDKIYAIILIVSATPIFIYAFMWIKKEERKFYEKYEK